MYYLYHFPVLGTAIADKKNNQMYLFNPNRTNYMIVPNSVMEEYAKEYKNVNIMLKPFNILVYEKAFKRRSHDIKLTKKLTEEELKEFLSDKTFVKYED